MNEPAMSKPVSVWATAQHDANGQRRGRYLSETARHPARMLPALAACAIEALTDPGDLVFDPLCGAGTTLVEALHLGRHAVGIDLEPHWASLARANISHTHRGGIGGYAHVLTADARMLPTVLPPDYHQQMRGRVQLVLTSPPYGPSVHGRVAARPGAGVTKWDHRYSARARPANLAHQPPHRLLAGMSQILAGCLPLLAPDGYVVLTARPWRQHGELVDLPGALTHTATAVGLAPVQRCAALLAGIRDDHLVTRASFFHRLAVNRARESGQPWHLICHEDILVFQPYRRPGSSRLKRVQAAPECPPAVFPGSWVPGTSEGKAA